MNKWMRLGILYVILAICVGSAAVSLASGKSVPEPLYALLGTLAGYVLLQKDKKKGDKGDNEGSDDE